MCIIDGRTSKASFLYALSPDNKKHEEEIAPGRKIRMKVNQSKEILDPFTGFYLQFSLNFLSHTLTVYSTAS